MKRICTLHEVPRPTGRSPARKVWMLRWKSTDGRKRFAETLGSCKEITRKQAEAARARKEARLGEGLDRRDKPEKIALGAYLERDLEAVRPDVKPTTALEYAHAHAHALAALGAEIGLEKIGAAEVGRIKTHLLEQGRATATVRKTIIALSASFRRAVDQGLIDRNPFNGAARGKTQSKPGRIFTPAEVGAMMAEAPDLWWRAFLSVLVSTGMRRAEALNLARSDIDEEAQTARISRKDAGTVEIDGEELPILPWTTKASAERVVPIPAGTLDLLRKLKEQDGRGPYCFLSADRLRAIGQRMAAGTWRAKGEEMNNLGTTFARIQRHARKRLAQERGVEVSEVSWTAGSLHDLRRTFITEMLDAGIDLLTITRWVGHASPDTTLRHYHRTKSTTADRGRAALGALYGGAEDGARTQSGTRARTAPKQTAGLEHRSLALIGPDGIMRADCGCSSTG